MSKLLTASSCCMADRFAFGRNRFLHLRKNYFCLVPRFLAIDTAEEICSVALFDNDELLYSRQTKEPNSHSKYIFGTIRDVIYEKSVYWPDISAFVLNLGPGSYTGLRIGSAAVKSISYCSGVPIIGISSLEIMAAAYRAANPELTSNDVICSAMDARRMEVFWQFFDHEGNSIHEARPAILDETEPPECTAGKVVHIVGSAWSKMEELGYFNKEVVSTENWLHAKHMGHLILNKWENSEFEDLAYFEPSYLKEFFFVKSRNK